MTLIQKWVAPGSVVHTYCWKAYSRKVSLPEGYTHLTVNHSENFVDPDRGCHTQGIESRWHAVKGYLPRCETHIQLLASYFAEYMFRKQYLDTAEDKFLAFMNVVKRVYKPKVRKRLTFITNNITLTPSASTYVEENQYNTDMNVPELNASLDTSMEFHDLV